MILWSTIRPYLKKMLPVKGAGIPTVKEAVDSLSSQAFRHPQIPNLIGQFGEQEMRGPYMAIKSDDSIHQFRLVEVSHLTASGAYTIVYHEDGVRSLLVGKNIGRFEEPLLEFGFIRIHKRYIVNLGLVSCYRASKGVSEVELVNGVSLRVARGRRPVFLKFFQSVVDVFI